MEPLDRVHVGGEPERVQIVVRVDQLHHPVQPRVVLVRDGHRDALREPLLHGPAGAVALGQGVGLEGITHGSS